MIEQCLDRTVKFHVDRLRMNYSMEGFCVGLMADERDSKNVDCERKIMLESDDCQHKIDPQNAIPM